MFSKATTWTDAEKRLAMKMKVSGRKHHEIAAAVGRSEMGVRSFFERSLVPRNTTWLQPVKSVAVPPDVWADRDRRANAPRTLTQLLMGDPV